MAENYKHLYEQMKKMVAMYQDELVPGFRKQIEELEKNQVKVRCKDCIYNITGSCEFSEYVSAYYDPNWFCADGEMRTNV